MLVHRTTIRLLTVLALAVATLLALAASAWAAPVMRLHEAANTTAAPNGTLDYFLDAINVGDEATNGDLTLTATLPAGLTADSADPSSAWDCSSLVQGASTITCTLTESLEPRGSGFVSSRAARLRVAVDPGATGTLTSTFEVSGGNAETVSTVEPTLISATPPDFGIDVFDQLITANAAGDPSTQAGEHPYAISTTILFNTLTNPNPLLGSTWPVEPAKDVFVDLPPGLVGDPTATGEARCTQVQLAHTEGVDALPLCPTGSQVGVATIITNNGFTFGDPLPVFNMVPPQGVPARFGFNAAGTVVVLDAALRSGSDYGLSVTVGNVPQGLALAGTRLTFWGIPSDSSHDAERSCPGRLAPWADGPTCATEAPRRAFLRNPTSCTAPGVALKTTLRIDSWDDPGDFKTAELLTHAGPGYPFPPSAWGPQGGTGGCENVPFDPDLTGAPVDAQVGAPAAFTFDLTSEQSDDPDELGTGDLRNAVVTLPKGLRVSPSSAAGLGACSPAQIKLSSTADPSCPGASKIGTMTVDTPLLDEQLKGAIYLGTPHDNPFDSLLSIYLVAKGPGLIVKLPGKVVPDPVTGQLSTSFTDNPQLPFSNLHLEFKGGPRAPLVNPPQCGTYPIHSVLTSWSGKTVEKTSTFTVSRDGNGTPCGAPRFSPQLSAGVKDVRAGKHTSFTLRLSRDDSDQELDALTVTTPRGLLAKVAGVPLCPAARAAAGTCSEASRVGSVLTGAGAGANPFYLPGRAYLTGPYKGGPYGLSIVVPAIAGPFDLGTVVVRASIRIDRRTAQLRVVSDPLPRILQGITLQVRDVRVTIDRPRFMVNPTSCAQKQVAASVSSTEGLRARVTDRFQVDGCAKLPLRPRLHLTIGSKGHTHSGHSTPLTARLTQAPGQSALRSVKVVLPDTLNALLPIVNQACTPEAFAAGHCGKKARTGTAVAVTPLLSRPLRGVAYFVQQPSGKGLPNLVVALRGQVDVDLVGKISIPGGIRLATSFDTIPDVPIKSFTLRLDTGSHGALGVVSSLCTRSAKRAKAGITFRGQNGKAIHVDQRLDIRGCGRSK